MQPCGSALRAGEGRHRPTAWERGIARPEGAARHERVCTKEDRGNSPPSLALALTAWGLAGPPTENEVSRRLTHAEGGKRSAPAGGSAKRPLPWDVAAGPGTECGDETG
jgi:hypothetical protein